MTVQDDPILNLLEPAYPASPIPFHETTVESLGRALSFVPSASLLILALPHVALRAVPPSYPNPPPAPLPGAARNETSFSGIDLLSSSLSDSP